MKSKAISRTSSRDGNVIRNSYRKAVVKNSGSRVVKKITKVDSDIDNENKEFWGKGTQTKNVYKKGVLVKTKTKTISANKIARRAY